MTQITASIQHASDTETNWIAANPILIPNQIYIASDVFYPNSTVPKIKIGKGLAWNDTEYLMQETLSNLLSEKSLHTWTPTSTFTQGQKFIWKSPNGDWRTCIVKAGQTLNAGETPFTNPDKIEYVDYQFFKNRTVIKNNFAGAYYYRAIDVGNGKMVAMNFNTSSFQIFNYLPSTNNYNLLAQLTFPHSITTTGPAIVKYIGFLNEFWLITRGTTNNNLITRVNATTNTIIGTLNPTGTEIAQIAVSEVSQKVFLLCLTTGTTYEWGFYDNTLSSFINTGHTINSTNSLFSTYYSARYDRIYYTTGITSVSINSINCVNNSLSTLASVISGGGMSITCVTAERATDPNMLLVYGNGNTTSQNTLAFVNLDANGVPISGSGSALAPRFRWSMEGNDSPAISVPELGVFVIYGRVSNIPNNTIYVDVYDYINNKWYSHFMNMSAGLADGKFGTYIRYDNVNKKILLTRIWNNAANNESSIEMWDI
jgi:hypothetical protein